MSTIRQSIITQLLSELGNISTANGYSFDVGNNIFDFRSSLLGGDEYPAIIIRDPVDDISEDDDREHNLQIDVIVAAKGGTSVADVREMIADVCAAFSNITSQTYVTDARYTGSEIMTDQEQNKFGAANIKFAVIYHTDLWEI